MSTESSSEDTLYDRGMGVRRRVLGSEYVDQATAHDDALTVEFQRFMTTYCWGEIWTDDRLSPAEHSLLVLGVTAALGKTAEFGVHARGALRNGVTAEQLIAVVRQITVYAGVPAAVAVLPGLRAAIAEHEQEAPS
jgi:4-carboxymuconolactone decarboxylase